MGFDKLKMLNEQIANSARLGQSTKHLERYDFTKKYSVGLNLFD